MSSRRLAASALAILVALGVVLMAEPDALAVSARGVAISKIPTAKAHKAITPKAKAGKSVKVLSKTLTVKKGSRVVARGVKMVKLPKGKYKVTTTVRYSIKPAAKKVVSDGSVAVAMHCVVSDVEINEVQGYQVELEYLDCMGGFDGVYKARAAYVDDPDLRATYGPMIWGESFIEHPDMVQPVVGTKFAATVKPVDTTLTKTVAKVKTATKAQTLRVK
jgi:hypothetical protein